MICGGLYPSLEKCAKLCSDYLPVTEGSGDTLEGSDIVNAVMEESANINIAIYIIMIIFTVILVSYAVYLSYQIVTKANRSPSSLSQVNLGHDYQPVPVSTE